MGINQKIGMWNDIEGSTNIRCTNSKTLSSASSLYPSGHMSFIQRLLNIDATAEWEHGVHYENTLIQIYRKFHLQKLKISR